MILRDRFFEFLRNELLSANDFLLNQTGQPQKLNQNEFVFAMGGPSIRTTRSCLGRMLG
jgi:hypothetical protein